MPLSIVPWFKCIRYILYTERQLVNRNRVFVCACMLLPFFSCVYMCICVKVEFSTPEDSSRPCCFFSLLPTWSSLQVSLLHLFVPSIARVSTQWTSFISYPFIYDTCKMFNATWPNFSYFTTCLLTNSLLSLFLWVTRSYQLKRNSTN